MKTRFRITSLFLTLLWGTALMAFPGVGSVAKGAEKQFVGVQNVTDRIDCVASWLRVEKEMDVPENFKVESGMVSIVNSMAGPEGIPVEEADPFLAVDNIILGAANQLLSEGPSEQNRIILEAFVEHLEEVPTDYCEPAEAYEEDPKAEVVEKDADYEPWIPQDPDPQPEPQPEGGWVYYGKPYDLEQITEVAAKRSTNGVLYFSDEDLVKLRFSGDIGFGYDEPGEAVDKSFAASQSFNGFDYLGFNYLCLSVDVDVPAFIAPFLTMGIEFPDDEWGWGSGQLMDSEGNPVTNLEDIKNLVNDRIHTNPRRGGGSEQYEFEGEAHYVPGEILDAPSVEAGTVEKTDRYYRYTWKLPPLQPEDNGAGGTSGDYKVEIGNGDWDNHARRENPSFTVTLYDNDNENVGDSILFDYDVQGPRHDYDKYYNDRIYYPEWKSEMDALVEQQFLTFVGLSPGGQLHFDSDLVGSGGLEGLMDGIDDFSFVGKDEHPGPGQPRIPHLINISDWHTNGRPLPDFALPGWSGDYMDTEGKLAYMFIGELFGPATGFLNGPGLASVSEGFYYNDFDLEDSFVYFRPYQTVADRVEPPTEEPNGNGSGAVSTQVMEEYEYENFRREDTPHKYTKTTGTHDMVVDIKSLDEAIDNIEKDPDLIALVDDYWGKVPVPVENSVAQAGPDELERVFEYPQVARHGAFKPGRFYFSPADEDTWPIQWYGYELHDAEIEPYKYGLQTVGVNEYGEPTCFTSYETLDRINSDGFLAYAVQVEEDIVNKSVLENVSLEKLRFMKDVSVAGSIEDARKTADLRERDAWFVKNADAQSGRVTKDHNGNWVRAQQYVLRGEDAAGNGNTSVQVLNASLRQGSDISTMVFTTSFNERYEGSLLNLPWKDWLGTQEETPTNGERGARYVVTTHPESGLPTLNDMSVEFKHGNDSLKESREFDERKELEVDGLYGQGIKEETLTLDNVDYKYGTGYTIDDSDTRTHPSGFDYVLSDGSRIDLAFYDAYDGNDGLETAKAEPYDREQINDIWDALRVNEGGRGVPSVRGNLEIAIGQNSDRFEQPIDVIYIPMSRMLWKRDQQIPH